MIDQAKLKDYLARRRDAQNLGLGILGGVIGAALGAVIWGALTTTTGFQIGFMAIGVGFLTGFGVRILGKGMDKIFGYVGALLSLAGCAVGNLLAALISLSNHEHIPFSTVMDRLTPQIAWQILSGTSNLMDVIFYAIALYFGYKYSFHGITPEELESLKAPEPQTPPAAATP